MGLGFRKLAVPPKSNDLAYWAKIFSSSQMLGEGPNAEKKKSNSTLHEHVCQDLISKVP